MKGMALSFALNNPCKLKLDINRTCYFEVADKSALALVGWNAMDIQAMCERRKQKRIMMSQSLETTPGDSSGMNPCSTYRCICETDHSLGTTPIETVIVTCHSSQFSVN